jgi:hypothetical protein
LCPKTAPLAPIGALGSSKIVEREQSDSLIIAAIPLAGGCKNSWSLTAHAHQPSSTAVPLRVLLRVWRI